MLTGDRLNKAINVIMAKIDDVNTRYIKKIGAMIGRIGRMTPSQMHQLIVMSDMGADVNDISYQLQNAANLTAKEVQLLYQTAVKEAYYDPRFKPYLDKNPPGRQLTERLNLLAQSVSAQTSTSMYNLSNTTAVTGGYRTAVDRAILAVEMGTDSYTGTIQNILKQVGNAGLQVQYQSGYHRRLDTAVRQNIIDGANQINQQAALLVGDEIGFDAVELSAHLRSAPDHEPVQGRVFLRKDFDLMQSGMDFVDVDGHSYTGFKRRIGEWNCMHFASPFDSKNSVRRYTDAQLEDWKNKNHVEINVAGRTFHSVYEVSQYMRELETEVRRCKDVAVTAQAAGDEDLRQEMQIKINDRMAKYYACANAAGIKPEPARSSVPGFKAVKIKKNA